MSFSKLFSTDTITDLINKWNGNSDNFDAVESDLVAHKAESATQADLGHIKLPENWVAPTLINGWVNFGGSYENAGYSKDEFGVVHLRGFIKSGTPTAGTILFTLPVGYRPAKIMAFSMLSFTPLISTAVEVYSDGTVRLGTSANNAYLTLSGISFRV